MNKTDFAKISLELGARYPYDAPDDWWSNGQSATLPATDKAHEAARGILHDLQDRKGIKTAFLNIDEETRKEIIDSLAEIIRQAYQSNDIKNVAKS